jgi:predicted MFS family arabinose efflux permease
MLASLFVLSMGQHLFIPLFSDIGMELAHSGKMGTTLGRLQGAGNLAAIAGSVAVFAGFRFFGLTFRGSFLVASACFLAAALLLRGMRKNKPQPAKSRFTLRREDRLYYWMTVLYGTRKQIFLTFGPWVLVTVFHRDVATIATILTIGGVIGIGFKPLLGRWIDRFGERAILTGEGLSLIVVCLGYGLSERLLPAGIAFGVVAACYLADNLLMSVGMARATWLRKIALTPADITPTLTMGVTIDHVFSIGVALLGGVIWKVFGYQYLFLMAAALACVSALVARRIVVPHQHAEVPASPDPIRD